MFFHSARAAPNGRPTRSAASEPAPDRPAVQAVPRLTGRLLLIVVSAGLGVIPAFLLKRVLEAIGSNNTRELSFAASGMIVIAIVTGALGVVQTLLSNQVGQRVMHDLRADVFRHLQQLSLAFFTCSAYGPRCSHGSRTTSAASRASSPTIPRTRRDRRDGMLLLSWQLALFARIRADP